MCLKSLLSTSYPHIPVPYKYTNVKIYFNQSKHILIQYQIQWLFPNFLKFWMSFQYANGFTKSYLQPQCVSYEYITASSSPTRTNCQPCYSTHALTTVQYKKCLPVHIIYHSKCVAPHARQTCPELSTFMYK